ncbi:AMMECR1 domain-containing protein [Gymnopilus junonius]|uniref:AMMECR1 domain-containing protein n=1 Tax=Gymnopilus junonius TaxID=109634 RepID=A0A9P5TUM1_GYMJU|nr:AMMECR1 domain-containing protein [Gymnopilus junonius]
MSLLPAQPTAVTTDVCASEHCFHAFDALYCSLTGSSPIPVNPLFVTWNIKQRGEWHLRGCIGTFEPMPIHQGIADYALISAFRDTRFRKIDKGELELLQCSISLLTNFEYGETYLDWTVGVHGIHITFPHPNLIQLSSSETPSPRSSSSGNIPRLFAIHKAGWRHRITEDLRRSIILERYQSSKYSVTWEEYIQWRKANEGQY